MTAFIRASGGILGSVLAVARNDSRVCQADYSDRWLQQGSDMLWPRTNFFGSSVENFANCLSSGLEIWDWDLFVQVDAGVGQRRDSISGITRNSAGAALGSVVVTGFDAIRDEKVDKVTSDATTGAYTITTPYTGQTIYMVAYKSGTPVYGASDILTPS